MTVRELIERLQAEPQDMTVIVPQHSEYSEGVSVSHILGYNNGGYISRAYRPEDEAKAHGFVCIGD